MSDRAVTPLTQPAGRPRRTTRPLLVITLALVLTSACSAETTVSAADLPPSPPLQPSWTDVLVAFQQAQAMTVTGVSHPGHAASQTFVLEVDRRHRCRWRLQKDTSLLPDQIVGDDRPFQAVRWDDRWLVQATATPLPGLLGALAGDPCDLLDGTARFSALEGSPPNYELTIDADVHADWLRTIRSRHIYDIFEAAEDPLTEDKLHRLRGCPEPFETLAQLQPVALSVTDDGRPDAMTIGDPQARPLLVLSFSYDDLQPVPPVDELIDLEPYDPADLLR